MADNILIAMGAIGYGLIPIGLIRMWFHYPALRLKLSGITVHMALVSFKAAALAIAPYTVAWDWSDLHRVTAAVAGFCFMWGMLEQRKQK